VPEWIEGLTWFTNLLHTDLLKGRSDAPCYQGNALYPGMLGQFGGNGCERTSEIIEDRQQFAKDSALGNCTPFGLLLTHSSFVVDKISLGTPQQIEVLFSLALFLLKLFL
jgi:hypothetical protein